MTDETHQDDASKDLYVVEHVATAQWYRSQYLTLAGPVSNGVFVSSKAGAEGTAAALNAQGSGPWAAKRAPDHMQRRAPTVVHGWRWRCGSCGLTMLVDKEPRVHDTQCPACPNPEGTETPWEHAQWTEVR